MSEFSLALSVSSTTYLHTLRQRAQGRTRSLEDSLRNFTVLGNCTIIEFVPRPIAVKPGSHSFEYIKQCKSCLPNHSTYHLSFRPIGSYTLPPISLLYS
jgi:hypothetical protein